jgi:hypothetical protein
MPGYKLGPMNQTPAPRSLPPSIDATLDLLASADYLADRSLATVLFLALRMSRPLFLEGEAGVGKSALLERCGIADRAHALPAQLLGLPHRRAKRLPRTVISRARQLLGAPLGFDHQRPLVAAVARSVERCEYTPTVVGSSIWPRIGLTVCGTIAVPRLPGAPRRWRVLR